MAKIQQLDFIAVGICAVHGNLAVGIGAIYGDFIAVGIAAGDGNLAVAIDAVHSEYN